MAEGRPVPTMTLPDLEALAGTQATQPLLQAPVRRESLRRGEKSEIRQEPREREHGMRDALDIPMSSLSSRSTASTTLQTPRTAPAPLPKEKDHKSSLSKAASQTLKRHPVSQVFRRLGGERRSGMMSRESPIRIGPLQSRAR